jgi:hypothetical protein
VATESEYAVLGFDSSLPNVVIQPSMSFVWCLLTMLMEVVLSFGRRSS